MNAGNIAKYEVFVTVFETGSLTAAAEKLGYTQSGVSRSIAELEKEFGFQLFRRGKNGCRLTKEGEKLLEPARSLLHAGELISETVDEINGLKSGFVRIGLFSSVAVHWAPGLVSAFQKKYPNIHMDFYAALYREVAEKIETEELDCGFLTRDAKTDLSFLELKHDSLLVVVSPDHPFANKEAFPVSQISKEDFIIPGEGSHYDIGRIFLESGIRPNVRFTLRDDAGVIAMVEKGLGISIFPELVLAGQTNKVKKLPLDPPFIRTIGLAYKKERVLSPAAREFIAFTTDWVKHFA